MGNAILFGGTSSTFFPSRKRPRDSSGGDRRHELQQQHQQDDDDVDPNRWVQDYDERRKRPYYWNSELQEVAWKLPSPDVQRLASRTKQPQSTVVGRSLPAGSEWRVAYDRTNRRPYYYHPRTQEARWEMHDGRTALATPASSAAKMRQVIVEYNGRRGLVRVPAWTSSLSTVREQLHSQLDEEVRPPQQQQNLAQDGWVFQLQPHQVLISKVQERDVQLFETLLEQHDPLIVKIHVRERTAAVDGNGSDESRREVVDDPPGEEEEDASQNGWAGGAGTSTLLGTTTGAAAATPVAATVATNGTSSNAADGAETNGPSPLPAAAAAAVTPVATAVPSTKKDDASTTGSTTPSPDLTMVPAVLGTAATRAAGVPTSGTAATTTRRPTTTTTTAVVPPPALPTAARPAPPPPPTLPRRPPTPPTTTRRSSVRTTTASQGGHATLVRTATVPKNLP